MKRATIGFKRSADWGSRALNHRISIRLKAIEEMGVSIVMIMDLNNFT